MAVDPQIRALAVRIRKLERQALQRKQPSLAYSSIDDAEGNPLSIPGALVAVHEATVAAVQTDIQGAYDALADFTFTLTTKSKHTLSANAPTTSDAGNPGDVWERHKAGDTTKIIGRWRLMSVTGGTVYTWSPMDLDRTYIPAIDIGTGTFGDLTGLRLSSDAIEARHITAGAVNGLIVTGRAIQTSDQGAPSTWTINGGVVVPVGIKMTNSGLVAYSPSGVAMSSINASSGRMTAVGGFSTASGYNDILITAGTATWDPAALRFYSASPGVDNGQPASLSMTYGDLGTTHWSTLTVQGVKYGGPTRPRIDIHTSRQQASNSANRGDISYHAGGSIGAGTGQHFFWIDGVNITSVDPAGLTVLSGFGIGVGGVSPFANGMYASGKIKTHDVLEVDDGLYDFGALYDEGWAGLTCKWGAAGRVSAITSTRESKHDIVPMTLEEAATALAMESVTFRYRPEQQMGDALHGGFLANQAADAGADLWVVRGPEDKPLGIEYEHVTSAHNMLIKDLYDRDREHVATIEALVGRIANLEDA